jgi:hypothetical protein
MIGTDGKSMLDGNSIYGNELYSVDNHVTVGAVVLDFNGGGADEGIGAEGGCNPPCFPAAFDKKVLRFTISPCYLLLGVMGS